MRPELAGLWAACMDAREHLAAAAHLMEAAVHQGGFEERTTAALEASAQCAIAMGYLLVSQAEHWAIYEGGDDPPAPAPAATL